MTATTQIDRGRHLPLILADAPEAIRYLDLLAHLLDQDFHVTAARCVGVCDLTTACSLALNSCIRNPADGRGLPGVEDLQVSVNVTAEPIEFSAKSILYASSTSSCSRRADRRTRRLCDAFTDAFADAGGDLRQPLVQLRTSAAGLAAPSSTRAGVRLRAPRFVQSRTVSCSSSRAAVCTGARSFSGSRITPAAQQFERTHRCQRGVRHAGHVARGACQLVDERAVDLERAGLRRLPGRYRPTSTLPRAAQRHGLPASPSSAQVFGQAAGELEIAVIDERFAREVPGPWRSRARSRSCCGSSGLEGGADKPATTYAICARAKCYKFACNST